MKKLFPLLTMLIGLMISTTCFAARQVNSYTSTYNACRVQVSMPADAQVIFGKMPRLMLYAKAKNGKPTSASYAVADKNGRIFQDYKRFTKSTSILVLGREYIILVKPVDDADNVYWILKKYPYAEASFNRYLFEAYPMKIVPKTDSTSAKG